MTKPLAEKIAQNEAAMKFYEALSTPNKFALAQQLAEIATYCDDYLLLSAEQVDALHAAVEALAGARANEIYGEEE